MKRRTNLTREGLLKQLKAYPGVFDVYKHGQNALPPGQSDDKVEAPNQLPSDPKNAKHFDDVLRKYISY